MGQILRNMTPKEQAMYDAYVKERPWLADVTMSDDELREKISKDLGDDFLGRWFYYLWNDHWNWVALAQFKYFYQTGMYKPLAEDYPDSQIEDVIMRILFARGVHGKIVRDVVLCNHITVVGIEL